MVNFSPAGALRAGWIAAAVFALVSPRPGAAAEDPVTRARTFLEAHALAQVSAGGGYLIDVAEAHRAAKAPEWRDEAAVALFLAAPADSQEALERAIALTGTPYHDVAGSQAVAMLRGPLGLLCRRRRVPARRLSTWHAGQGGFTRRRCEGVGRFC